MIVGYLMPHRCPGSALGGCIQCRREYCEEHLSLEPSGLVCRACLQGLSQPVAQPALLQEFSPAYINLFANVGAADEADEDTFSDLS